MKIPFVDLHAQYQSIKCDIDSAIADVIRESGYIRSRFVDEFEEKWALAVGVRHCVSCANGTDALYISLRAMGVKPGDEVITTAHSWISTSETITQAGGRVVFCDTESDTYTINPADIVAKITNKTVGIIPVHLYGQPADMDAIEAIAQKHKLWIIEDCAQAHLATCGGRQVGTFGSAATFSFYPGKNLGAYGDAGCIVTGQKDLADWMATYARHGGKGNHVIEGINSRMDGIQAAVLNVKMCKLMEWTKARQRVAEAYTKGLTGLGDIVTPHIADRREHVFHLYVIRTSKREELRKHLEKAEISTALNYPKALPFYPAYAYLKHTPADFPIAARNQDEILSLPIFPELKDGEIAYVIECIRRFFDCKRGV